VSPGAETFFGRLNETEQAALLRLGRTIALAPGSLLMCEGELGDRVMILLSGRVKVTRCSGDGNESLLGIRDPGDLLGEMAYIDQRTRVASVTALERVRALVISGAVFRAYLERSPRMAMVVLEVVTQRLRETAVTRASDTHSDATARLAARLTELADRYGIGDCGDVEIDLPLSQEDLRAWTGASRASVAKSLQQLRDLRWIDTGRRRIVVRNVEALRRRAA
jgi:CRP-like cAMP-binding protein